MTAMSEELTEVSKDRNALKIASFRTKEGDWADFCAAAANNNLTATDVLKAAMEQYTAGEYVPLMNTGMTNSFRASSNITREEIQELIGTALSALSIELDELRAEVNSLKISAQDDLDPAVVQTYLARRSEKMEAEIEAFRANTLASSRKKA
jgi:hypothetical protein